MNNKTEIISAGIAKTGAGLIGGGWVWEWLGTNQPQITALCGMIGVIGLFIGGAVNIWHKRKMQKHVKKRSVDYEAL